MQQQQPVAVLLTTAGVVPVELPRLCRRLAADINSHYRQLDVDSLIWHATGATFASDLSPRIPPLLVLRRPDTAMLKQLLELAVQLDLFDYADPIWKEDDEPDVEP